jgi:hypothetical protein
MYTKFWFEIMKRGDQRDDSIKIDLRELVLGIWADFVWHRIGTSGRLL